MTALLLSCFLLAAPVQVELAPDQPLNFIYVDDPLIVELSSDTDRNVTVEVAISAAEGGGQSVTRSFENVPLRASAVRWLAVEDLPPRRGYYTARVRVVEDGDAVEHEVSFCRIDRPREEGRLPVYARNPKPDPPSIVALRHAGIRGVRFGADSPTLAEDAAFFATRGFDVTVRLDAEDLNAIDLNTLAPVVSDWEVSAEKLQGIRRAVRSIRDAGSSGSAVVAVRGVEEFKQLLAAGLADLVQETVVEGPDTSLRMLAEIRQAASAAGYEEWTVSAGRLADVEERGLAVGLIDHIAFGTRRIGIDPDAFVQDALKAPYVRLAGLAQHLQGVEHAGTLALGDDVHAPVFRSGAQWLIVLWTDGDNRSIEMELPKVRNLALSDGANNSLPAPVPVGGVAQFNVGPAPRYLHGVGGAIVGRAAANKARNLARRFADDEVYREYLPKSLIEQVRAAAKSGGNGLDRTVFFGMLREFPELEAQWHAGNLPRNVAAPALRDLAQITRALCAAEERSSEPFLEPLGDTLARCDDYMSIYITDSVAESQHRGDWLLDEVRRLADEAKRLNDEGRRIEASALGAMAEWRARALEAAGKAGTKSGRMAEVEVAAAEPLTKMEDADGDAVSSTVVERPVEPEPEPEPASAEPEAVPGAEVMPDSDTSDATPDSDESQKLADAPESEVADKPETPRGPAEAEAPRQGSVHVVKSGENPSVIASKYGVKTSDLLRWNGLTARSRIDIGDKLVVSPAAAAQPLEAGQPKGTVKVIHTVVRGDNPAVIAKKYGVKQLDFERWNNLRHNTALARGKQYTVYVPSSGAVDAPSAVAPLEAGQPVGTRKVTHTVARGDSPYTIARKHKVTLDDLLKWNKLTKRSVLQIGQKLTVYTKQ